jgi:hypothetical protein
LTIAPCRHPRSAIYRRLRAIEARLQKDVTTSEVLTLEADLECVDQEINNLGVPMQHSQLFFPLNPTSMTCAPVSPRVLCKRGAN